MPAKPGTAGLALLLVAALLAGSQARGSTALPEQSSRHVDCMALYALLSMAVPSHAHPGNARVLAVLQIYREENALDSSAKTDAEIEQATDDSLGDLRGCDSVYEFSPTPQLWAG